MANIGIFGQSLSQALARNNALSTFKQCFAAAGDPANVTSYCLDGSAVLKEHAPSTDLTRYWVDRDASGNWVDGPCLLTAAGVVAAAPAAHKPIDRVILMIGESSSVMPVLSIDVAAFKGAYRYLVSRLKAICSPSSPNSVGFMVQPVGRRLASAEVPGVQVVREAQLDLVADPLDGFVFGVDVYDLPLWGDRAGYGKTGDSHPDTLGDSILGWRAAQRVLMSKNHFHQLAPRVVSVYRYPDRVTLRISTSGGAALSQKPAVPRYFSAGPAGAPMAQLSGAGSTWTGDYLSLVVPGVAAGWKLMYPFGDLREIDRSALIADENGSPLQSFVVTLT